jgi:hypothetical protein
MRSTVRIVNLETGMPTVEQALHRLSGELYTSRRMGCTAVKLIHGYGSSGKGGKIRLAVRRELEGQALRNQIKGYIPGEKFSIFESATLSAFSAAPDLRKDADLDRYNNGITFVLL